MKPIDESRVNTAKKAAISGGQNALSMFRENIERENKQDPNENIINPSDIVTEADRETQAIVTEIIREDFPNDVIVGEEGDGKKTVPNSGLSWIIDPIDGTYNYARGDVFWATSIAIVRDQTTIGAVNYLPAVDDIYVADKDNTYRNNSKVTVSTQSEPKYSTIELTAIPDYGNRKSYSSGLINLIKTFGNIRSYGSAQVAYSLMASGVIDGIITGHVLEPWDTVAGIHMIRQAGGVVTDLTGNKWTIDCERIVASNGYYHQALLDLAQAINSNQKNV